MGAISFWILSILIISTSASSLQCKFVNLNPLAYFDVPLNLCLNSQSKQGNVTQEWSETLTCNTHQGTIESIKYPEWDCKGALEDKTIFASSSQATSLFNCHAPGMNHEQLTTKLNI